MSTDKKLSGWIRDPDLYLACLSLAVLVAVTIGGVLMRYIVNRPFGWMEEVQLWCFVWTVFPGASAVARHGGHIAIDAFVGLFPHFLRRMASRLIQLVTVAVLGFFGLNAFRHVVQMYTTGRATNILAIPYFVIYAVVPLSCLLMILTALHRLARPKIAASAVEAAIEEAENV